MAGVFISYRSADQAMAGALHAALVRNLGAGQVFYDVADIGAGDDFAATFLERLHAAEVLLVVIGPQWLRTDSSGTRPIDRDNDKVHREIATGFQANLKVVPALVENTRMPSPSDLPSDIRNLSRQQYLRIDYRSLDSETASVSTLLPVVHALEQAEQTPRNVEVAATDWLLSAPARTPAEVSNVGIDPTGHDLIRLQDADGNVRLPAFQFDSSGHQIPVVMRVNGILDAENDPWGVADWWLWPNVGLDAVPSDLIGEVGDEVLVAAAEAEVAEA